jgi:hypothetical protein
MIKMPKQDLEDFEEYWNLSMFNEEGNLRNPGGNPDSGGVDYSKYLIPWCKGNSISVDQSTLREPRLLISLLIEKFKNRIRQVESREARKLGHQSGVTLKELVPKFNNPFTKTTRKYQARDINPKWVNLERLLQVLLVDGHIALFSDSDTLHPNQQKIIDRIANDAQTRGLLPTDERGQPQFRDQMYIANALDSSRNAHIRMSRSKGWELYIKDHYGSPDGVNGIIPGSLTGGALSFPNKSMPLPLHLVFAETMARAMSRESEWGKNQSMIRRVLTDNAIDGDGFSVSLDRYYMEHARKGASHMADYFLGRSVSDIASAEYDVFEVPDSDPKSWRVRLDPDLVRWRQNRRNRERKRGGSGGDGQ